ncbi:ATP-binding protein [Allorhodopirellula solitaria]|uniref:histidine kinase n=1 Tax=Allorhodopirellula solitaria TaxID=2527987 RepID=A0A5C5XYM7_9BACT|nr:ATP-binding protein [Allorhodopirellula solitaria]TWT67393.1 Sensor protein RstB [Allorhodopirellula solitaria]
MTRLFLRFYIGVILIMFIAWCIQVYVYRRATESENIAVIEDALSGGTLLARDELLDGGTEHFGETLGSLQKRFNYPVSTMERSARSLSTMQTGRLDSGEAILHGGAMVASITGTDLLVQLGPLPQFVGPSRRNVLLGLGSIFLLAAAAITILLRPIVKQFRTVEQTALAIADGDLSARIAGGENRRSLPIADAFNAMADRVESLLRNQKELLQAVSHELRTPLSRIQFATELVRSASSEEKRNQRIDSIDDATNQLDDLVGELLDYTRHDAGCETAPYETVMLQELIEDAVEPQALIHPRIHFHITQAEPQLRLNTYRAGLQRAIGNLVSNAAKYARSRVSIGVHEHADGIVIAVEDDGLGIAAADRDVIFEPFKRLEAAAQPGTGLGLALVRRICQRLGGDVTVSTSSLGGAKFAMSVPHAVNDAD